MQLSNNLIVEGKFDKETTELGRQATQKIKEYFLEQDPANRIYHFYLKCGSANCSHIDYIVLSISPASLLDNEPYTISGVHSAVSDLNNQERLLSVNFYYDPYFDKQPKSILKQMEKISHKIKETIRHELEHSIQNPNRFKHYRKAGDNPISFIMYLRQEIEIEAFVAGLYKHAKSSRTPFIQVLNLFFSSVEAKLISRYKKELPHDKDQQRLLISTAIEGIRDVRKEFIKEAVRKKFIK